MKKFGAIFLVLGMLAATPAFALANCRLVSVTVTYHPSTGQTTTTYNYECDGPI